MPAASPSAVRDPFCLEAESEAVTGSSLSPNMHLGGAQLTFSRITPEATSQDHFQASDAEGLAGEAGNKVPLQVALTNLKAVLVVRCFDG